MYKEDETVCGPLCQHPGCWQSSLRKAKGFPRHAEHMRVVDSEEDGLPTLKICNLLDDDAGDQHPYMTPFYSMQSMHSRTGSMPSLLMGDANIASLPAAKTPNTTPSSARQFRNRSGRKPEIKLVEVQEVFDLTDLGSTWDDTFVAKKYLVWVPNPMKTSRKHRQLDPIDTDSMKRLNKEPLRVAPKDLTEDMMPRKIERQRTEMVTKHRSRSRSPPSRSRYNVSKSTRKPVVDSDGMSDLLSLPRDMLLEVLDKSKESDFTTREKVQHLIKRTFPLYDRSCTNASLDSMEIFKQQKMTILDAKSRTSYKELTDSKPVFILDNGQQGPSRANTPEQRADIMSDYDSMRESYSLKDYTMERNRKAIPNLLAYQLLDRHRRAVPRVPSISLGLPELPSGMRLFRTTNYKRKDLDFSLGPVPMIPSSARSTESPGSEHGTTVRVHAKSEGSEEYSDIYPYGGPFSDRGSARNRMFHQPLHKDFGGQVRANSPSHPIRAPVNTPNTQQALSPEPTANLDTITETSPDLRIYFRPEPKSGKKKAPMNAKRRSPSPNGESSKSPSKGMSTTSANEEKFDSRAASKSPPQSEGNSESPNRTESMDRVLIEDRAMDTPGPPPPSPDFKKITTPMKDMDADEGEDENIPMSEHSAEMQISSTVAEHEPEDKKINAGDEVDFINSDLQNVENNTEDAGDGKVSEIPRGVSGEVESTEGTDSGLKTVLKNEPPSAEESQPKSPNRDTGHGILLSVEETVPEKTSQEDVNNGETDANSNAQAGVVTVHNVTRESEDVNMNAQTEEGINNGDGVGTSNSIDHNSSGDKHDKPITGINGQGNDAGEDDTLFDSAYVVDANQGKITLDHEGEENDVQLNVEKDEPHFDNEVKHDEPHFDNEVEHDEPHVHNKVEYDEPHVDNEAESDKPRVDNKLEHDGSQRDKNAESDESHVDYKAESVEPHVDNVAENVEPHVDNKLENVEPHVDNKLESDEPHVEKKLESDESHIDNRAENDESHVDNEVEHVDVAAEETKLVEGTDQGRDQHVSDIDYHDKDDDAGLENVKDNFGTSQTIEGDQSDIAIVLTESSENVEDSRETREHDVTLQENVEPLNENKAENDGQNFAAEEKLNDAYVNTENEVTSNKRTVNDDTTTTEDKSMANDDGPYQQVLDDPVITEDGGDNEAFKEELRDELRRLSEED